MEDIRLTKLRSSLTDAISEWIDNNSEGDGWDALNTHVSEYITELMASSAFNILLAQSDLTSYYESQNMLKK
jgi:hypothetical protein